MLAGHADDDNNTLIPNDKRLNDGVVANVYHHPVPGRLHNDLRIDPRLPLAAQLHTNDVLGNRALNGDSGSDGSIPKE
jgi:hypothetical protein